jgi:hypothetical protein
MNTQERIQQRHKLLDYLVIEKPEGASLGVLSSIFGAGTVRAVDDLLYLGLIKEKGGKFVVPEAVAKRWVRIRGRDD